MDTIREVAYNPMLSQQEIDLLLLFRSLKKKQSELNKQIGSKKKKDSLYSKVLAAILGKGEENNNLIKLKVSDQLLFQYKRVGNKGELDKSEAVALLSRLLAQGVVAQEEFDKVFSKDSRYWKLEMK